MPNNDQITRVMEAAEAICGALYETGWESTGEQDGITYWKRGEKPHTVAVQVIRSKLAPFVITKVEWHNLSVPGKVLRGMETLQVDCTEYASRMAVQLATERVIVRCLEVLRDSVSGQGVAGPEAVSHLNFTE